jgi:hypothetical protein
MRLKQKGVMTYFTAVAVMIIAMVFTYGTKLVHYKATMSHYRDISSDILAVAKSWEVFMNYRCVEGNVPLSLGLSDLPLPKSNSGDNYGSIAMSYTPPPNLSITLEVAAPPKSAKAIEKMIEISLSRYSLGSDIAVTTTSGSVILESRRVAETSKILVDGVRRNTTALQSTVWLQGLGVYDSNGC